MCTHAKKPCSTCLPLKDNKCVNTLLLRANSVIDSSRNCVLPIVGDGLVKQTKNGLTNAHVNLASEVTDCQGLSAIASDELMNASRSTGDHVSLPEPRYDFCHNSSSCINESATGNAEGLSSVDLQDSRSSLDKLMITAYSHNLLYCDGGPHNSVWCQRWSIIVQCMGQHYSLPGGSIGRKYIDLLCAELQHLSLGTYHSEQVIVFCSVMLQRDHLVRKGCDICRFLGEL